MPEGNGNFTKYANKWCCQKRDFKSHRSHVAFWKCAVWKCCLQIRTGAHRILSPRTSYKNWLMLSLAQLHLLFCFFISIAGHKRSKNEGCQWGFELPRNFRDFVSSSEIFQSQEHVIWQQHWLLRPKIWTRKMKTVFCKKKKTKNVNKKYAASFSWTRRWGNVVAFAPHSPSLWYARDGIPRHTSVRT